MAPLSGATFAVDSAEVHTYIVNFIAGKNTVESKIQAHTNDNDGRRDFIAIKARYQGNRINAIDVVQAKNIIETLYYI